MPGRVYLVGAGPGAPDLITVRGLGLLKRADVVVYDRLVSPRLVEEAASAGAELVYVGKAPGRHEVSQDEINEILAREALRGKVVVRLKGGDPLTFGRGEEECLHLARAGVECSVVPGVPSFVGAAAEYLIPLAGRGFSSSFAVATGTRAGGHIVSPGDVERILSSVDTAVFLMASRAWDSIMEAAARLGGVKEWVAVVERATLPGSRLTIGRAGELAAGGYKPSSPAVIVVGGSAWWRAKTLGAEYS